MKFSVIVTGYNCEQYANECINSVLDQTYAAHEILIYNDASNDNTKEVLRAYEDNYPTVKVINANKNRGALFGRYTFIHEHVTGDVVCFLGLDDKLDIGCLEVLSKYYSDPKVKMTYGSWKSFNNQGYQAKPYDKEVFENKSFRTSGWRATALNTFRTDLIKKVPTSVLLNQNGNFFDNCTDLAYSFPCLEMCKPEEVAVVKEFIYIYRVNNPQSTLSRLGRTHKTKVREQLKRIKPL